MKVYIDTDTEGSACVVGEPSADGRQIGPFQFEYVRRRLPEEVTAAVEGARSAGATDIVVHDCGYLRGFAPAGTVLYYDELPRGIRIALGRVTLEEVVRDSGFDAAFLLGRHARAGVETGVLAHSFSTLGIDKLWLNGEEIGEIGIKALELGSLGIPIALLTADEDGVREAKELLGDIEVVATKKGYDYHGAISLHPADACDLIRKHAALALGRLDEFKPFHIDPPYELKILTSTEEGCEARIKRHPNSKRLGPCTLVKTTDNPLDIWGYPHRFSLNRPR